MKIQPSIYLAIGLVAGGTILSACGKKQEGNAQQQQIPELSVITVGEEDASLESGYPATLHGENDVEIRPQITGFAYEGKRTGRPACECRTGAFHH